MLPNPELLTLAKSVESQYLERKRSCPDAGELRATFCAFANSTPENQFSVLFIGIEDNGEVCGVDSTSIDGTQKKIIKVARDDCYPSIYVIPQVVEIDGKAVIAVIVEHSGETPHFTGHAYARRGPTSAKASKEQYDEFVLMRINKVARLLREKKTGSIVRTEWKMPLTDRQGIIEKYRVLMHPGYRVEDCDAFVLKLFNTLSMATIAVPIDRVTISYSPEHHATLLLLDMIYPGFK